MTSRGVGIAGSCSPNTKRRCLKSVGVFACGVSRGPPRPWLVHLSVWRKRLRLGIAIFGLCLTAFVIYVIRPRDTRPPVARSSASTPRPPSKLAAAMSSSSRASKQDLRVEFAVPADLRGRPDGPPRRQADGRQPRAGRNFIVTGKEARVGANQASFDINGDVKLEASDGLVADRAASASYSDAEGIVRAPGPVQFSRGRMAGRRHRLHLRRAAQHRVAARPGGRAVRRRRAPAGPMDVAAGAAGFARGERYMRFERGVRMTRAGQIIEADEATAHLFPDRDEPDQIELRGNSRITGGEGLGALRLHAARATSTSITPRTAARCSRRRWPGRPPSGLAVRRPGAGQQLNGEFIAFELAADGAIKTLASRDRGQRRAAGGEGRAGPHDSRAAALGARRAGPGPDGHGASSDSVVFRRSGRHGSRRAHGALASARPAAQPVERRAR